MRVIDISKRRVQVLLDTAARYEAVNDARSHAENENPTIFDPNNNLGAIVCDAWRIETRFAVDALSAYYSALTEESNRCGAPVPPISAVIEGMRQSVTGSLSTDIDVEALLERLRELPALRSV
ncbi:hypothetical protein ACTJKO_00625 [Curtobacterium sp. 22159]|uniref:hypothetical protein n=1 Tax=Curtobacterium sp. 22159 TaxID=3453882 RepID=UPI003F86ABB5